MIAKHAKRKAVVTGGAGFIGSNLAHALAAGGWEVHVVDIDPAFRKSTLPKKAKLHVFDIRNTKKLAALCKGADVIYHLAAQARVQYSIEYPVETTDNNVVGTVSVLDAAVKAKVRRVVYSASSSAYGDQAVLPLKEGMPERPKSPYGLQKFVGELCMRLWSDIYQLETVSLRYFNVYGPGLDPNGAYALVLGRFIEQRLSGAALTITGDGTQTRDFTHVRDVVEANLLAADSKKVGKGEIINIGSGKSVSMNQLAQYMGGKSVYIPPRIEPHDTLADIRLADKLLGWKPKEDFTKGIRELKRLFKIDQE